MKANPGGYIEPANILGRDKLIERIWSILENRSLVLSAERRIGKTCILNKMEAQSKTLGNNPLLNKYLIIKRDLEGLRSPTEFVDCLYKEVEEHLSKTQKTTKKFNQLLDKFKGSEIAGVKLTPTLSSPSWKTFLSELFSDLIENQNSKPVFFFDEFPLMLDNIIKDHGENAAMEILDILRATRQTHKELRMVYTGSIGLHHIINKLKKVGYGNDPTNDMQTLDVLPLSFLDAKNLAVNLLKGENIQTTDLEEVASNIAKAVDGHPFYIHGIVDELKWCDETVNTTLVNKLITNKLIHSQDPWHLHYYKERISKYYSEQTTKFSLKLLDILSLATKPLPFAELFNHLKSKIEIDDEEMIREVLKLLEQDHYISKDTNGHFQFRLAIIQNFWRINRS